jgi:hypothetical protein
VETFERPTLTPSLTSLIPLRDKFQTKSSPQQISQILRKLPPSRMNPAGRILSLWLLASEYLGIWKVCSVHDARRGNWHERSRQPQLLTWPKSLRSAKLQFRSIRRTRNIARQILLWGCVSHSVLSKIPHRVVFDFHRLSSNCREPCSTTPAKSCILRYVGQRSTHSADTLPNSLW